MYIEVIGSVYYARVYIHKPNTYLYNIISTSAINHTRSPHRYYYYQ